MAASVAPSDRAPVLVGVAQYTGRCTDPAAAPDPVTMLADVAMAAAEDAGVGGDLFSRHVDTYLQIPMAHWFPSNPARLTAERLGIPDTARVQSTGGGGEIGVLAANHLAGEILAGRADVAVVTGGNCWKTHERAEKAGVELHWPTGGGPAGERFGEPLKPMISEVEQRHGLTQPIQMYPLFENALRAAQGLTLEEHAQRLGQMMSDFTAVAAANPHAWFPVERTPQELTTVTEVNRMIGFPYTKYLNAVISTDQAAAFVMTSVGTARALGIPEHRWVHWWGGHHAAEEAWFVSSRPDFAQCPAMRVSSLGALAQAGVGVDDVGLFDFYSCFPIAVRQACRMLGIHELDERPFTVTGGLPYAGGPGSAYTMHSLAAMADRLREAPEEIGMVTGNGYILTKHAASVWSARPKTGGWEAPTAVDASNGDTAPREPVAEPKGRGTVEAYTVMHRRDGQPETGYVCGRLDSGERFLAVTPSDPELLSDLLGSEAVGRTGRVHVDGDRNVFTPN